MFKESDFSPSDVTDRPDGINALRTFPFHVFGAPPDFFRSVSPDLCFFFSNSFLFCDLLNEVLC